MCCTRFPHDCDRATGALRFGDSSRRSEEIVRNLDLGLSVRLLLLSSSSSSSSLVAVVAAAAAAAAAAVVVVVVVVVVIVVVVVVLTVTECIIAGHQCCLRMRVPDVLHCNNNNNNRIQRRYSRFFTISSQRREPSSTRTLKWPGRNRVQITCNTSSAYHVQVSCQAIRFDRVEIAFI